MEHRPCDFLRQASYAAGLARPGLVILNQPIGDLGVFERLWRNSSYVLCADGGANRLHDVFGQGHADRREQFLPNNIHGDLDSLRDDVRQYYASRNVEVTRNPDQMSTDLGKALDKIRSAAPGPSRENTILLGTLGGRVDQALGILHELLRERRNHPAARLWLFSETNISFLLFKGENVIHTRFSEGFCTENVGLIPIFCPARITTSGLEWDVADWETSMGYRISTSNHIVDDTVTVHTDEVVLFTMERSPSLPEQEKIPIATST
ncbi:thiamine pyrophosphokinase-like protein 1 [Lineolata rhizophorae]|uniref:Thiamine pyrophosphokinase n=1 Tax=Lineolata rhizophorae TaxID=578093 RepID=A0A6A6NY79_9PEZI|nr:thiamine pyrophosphokinase-like protein 1 [Lineolata rhizophorae]